MSIPPDSDDDFSWGEATAGEMDPGQRADLARQVRIMLASGKTLLAIHDWLQDAGLTSRQAEIFLRDLPRGRPSDRWERFFSRAALVGIGVLSVAVLVLVLVKQPWDGSRWSWTGSVRGSGPREIDAVGGFVLFCFLYAVLMAVLWIGAVKLGAFFDRLGEQ